MKYSRTAPGHGDDEEERFWMEADDASPASEARRRVRGFIIYE